MKKHISSPSKFIETWTCPLSLGLCIIPVGIKTTNGNYTFHHIFDSPLLDNWISSQTRLTGPINPINRLIIQHRFDLKKTFYDELQVQVTCPQSSLIDHELFLEFCGPKDPQTETPLHIAATFGYQRLSEILLDYGSDIQAKNREGLTPLHIAANKGHASLVRCFINRGADIHAQTPHGWTPLHLAITDNINSYPITNILLEAGSDNQAIDIYGLTPLQYSIIQESDESTDCFRSYSIISFFWSLYNRFLLVMYIYTRV